MAEENKMEELVNDIVNDNTVPKEEEIIVGDTVPKKEEIQTQEKPEIKNSLSYQQNKEINEIINTRVDMRVKKAEKLLEKKITAEREAYIAAIETIKDRQEAAIESNNMKEYVQTTEAIKKLEIKKEELDSDLKVIKEDPSIEPEKERKEIKKEVSFDESGDRWVKSNLTFIEKLNNDPEASALAAAISKKLLNNGYVGKPQAELFAEVKKRLIDRMPDDFATFVQKDEIPNVSGGKMDISNNSGNSNNKKVYTLNDVPTVDRQILKNFISKGVYTDEKTAVASYFKHKQQESR